MDALCESTGAVASNLGEYRLIAVLGQGGMAAAHLAVRRGPAGFHKLVVLKEIDPQYTADPDVLGMFLDEARLAARLSHPNVVQTNRIDREGARHFIEMEYLEGQPLNRIVHRLSAAGGLPVPMHLRVIADLLGGLHHAHELADYDGSPLGVVHRDVSPQNIFVTYDGVVKVIDFGVAKARGAVVQTRFGVIKGKVAYMAPEQARGEPLDRRADIFGVGVMLWEAVTGARPWKGVPEPTVMNNLVEGKFPSVREAAPGLSQRLVDIILKALAPDRADRYATAAELQGDLEAYLAATGERVHPRALGELVSSHFAADRAAIRRRVEARLQTDDRVAPAPLSPLGSPSPQLVRSTSTSPSGLTISVPEARSGQSRARRARLGWLGALGMLALSAVAGLWLHQTHGAPPSAEQRPAPEAASTSTLLPPPARVPATPVDAQLVLDEADPWLHGLAPGSVTQDDDPSITVAVTAEPVVHRGSSRARAKQRQLDSRNPYAAR